MSRLLRAFAPAVLAILLVLVPSSALAATLVATTTTVTATPATADAGACGGSIKWTIDVTPDVGSGPVTGNGTWTLSGPSGVFASNTFAASTANLTITASGLAPGTYTLAASYAGDATFAPSSGSAAGTFAQVATTTTVTATPPTADAGAEGSSIKWTVNVTRDSGTGSVQGTGTWTLSGPSGVFASNTFDASQTNLTITASGLAPGTYTLSASFAGNTTFLPSSGSADGTFAAVATTTTVTATPPTADAGAEGTSIKWTVNVTRNTGSGPVHGTGTWTLSGPSGVIASNTFDASQSNLTVTAAGLGAGTYTLSASYPGDSTFLASSGSADGTFAKVATTTTVTATPPTALAGSGGGSIKWTVNVTRDTGTGPVHGTGNWTLTGPSGVIASNTFDASVPNVSITAAGLAAGTYTLSASYAGDTTFLPSSGSADGRFVDGTAAVVLASSANPSVFGTAVTFTATVTGSGGTPTGSVAFREGATTLATVPLSASGQAALTTASLPVGSHDLTAAYSGDTSYAAATSGILTQVVNLPAPPDTVATLSPAANGEGWNSTPVTVTLTATPSPMGGSVAATYYAVDDPSCTPAARATCSTYSGPFSVAADGVHTVTFFSVDSYGSAEALRSATVKVDKVAPVTTATPGTSPNGSGWYRAPVTVSFAATDATSGVDRTEMSLDGGPWTPVAGSTTVSTDGSHSLAYRSTDAAGNVETARTLTLKIDLVAPALSITVTPGTPTHDHPVFTAQGTAFFFATHGSFAGSTPATCVDTRGLRLNLAAADGASGVAAIVYSATGAQHIGTTTIGGAITTVSITRNGLTTFTAMATDGAGNAGPAQRWALVVDGDRPLACGMPLGSLSIPTHGRLFVLGKVSLGHGIGLPFVATFRY